MRVVYTIHSSEDSSNTVFVDLDVSEEIKKIPQAYKENAADVEQRKRLATSFQIVMGQILAGNKVTIMMEE